MVEVAFKVLTFNVENTPVPVPGAPLLILETVRVDNANELVVMVDPVRVEQVADLVVRVLTTILDVVAVAVVCIVLPVSVETFNCIVLNAAKLELRDVR